MTDPISRRPAPGPTRTSDDARAAAKRGGSTPSEKPTAKPPASTAPAPDAAAVGTRRTERSGRTVLDRRDDASPTPTRTRSGKPLGTEHRELARLALDTRGGTRLVPGDDRRWDPRDDDLTGARNAHHSNSPEQMREALEHDYNWLEGDLRVDDDGELVMAHDSSEEGAGLTLDEWLTIGGASERGLKVDVKEDEALPALLDALEASDIPDGRLMINVQARQVDEDSMRAMRERFPDAWLAPNPRIREGRGYDDASLDEVARLADAAGGRISFPIRWDIASQGAIEHLKPHGRVSIWTADSQGTPDDRVQATSDLRRQGVDGVIDLGSPLTRWESVQTRFVDIWESEPVRGARDVVDTVGDGVGWVVVEGGDLVDAGIDLGSDVASDGLDLAGDLAGGARDLASDIPGIGGLFD